VNYTYTPDLPEDFCLPFALPVPRAAASVLS
jgi:hypothetical protein